MKCRRCFEELEIDEELEQEEFCSGCITERAAVVPPLNIEQTFGPGGALAGGNRAYEARPGQVRLAREILDALAGDRPLLAEGPCGIGKSKAYGVPAAWLASHGKRVLIVTASIALQEQLIKKDLPDLKRELGWDFDFALMKGKSNYVCKSQLEMKDNTGLAYQDALDFQTIGKWTQKTKTGDKSELLIKPSDLVWSRFSTSADACTGTKCPNYKTCYAYAARDAAATAGIIVCNYHLFFLNLAYGGQILPASDVVILDEAHEAADIARELLGFNVSEMTFRRFARDAVKRGFTSIADELRAASAEVFETLARFYESGYYKALLRGPIPMQTTRIEAAVDDYVRACAKSHLVDNALAAKRRLVEGIAVTDPNCVYFLEAKEPRPGENGRRRVSLRARYVAVGPVLRSMLWEGYSSVAAVSATLTTDGRFDFLRRELGVPDAARELAVESPFDFPRQAMLVVPPADALPEPNDPAFVEVTAQRVIETIEACGGRTLGLFTSYKAVNAVYDRVRQHVNGRYRILRQGEMPPSLLAKAFKEDTRSVLLATTSFWTGIDVPGDALTGLVIDRIPFGSPEDPVTIRISETDPRNAFAGYTVPKAILVFRQGVGRLIRSLRDVGVVVVLDKRLTTKTYGGRFLKSLPPMSRASSTTAIAGFLRQKGVAA